MLDDIGLKIDEAYRNEKPSEARAYIGASNIGNGCTGFLALSLRGFPDNPHSPRMLRIFRLGHKIEKVVVDDLKKAGYSVWDVDPLTGRQHQYTDYGGHVRMHTDGLIEMDGGKVRVLEIKSMNNKKFNEFKEMGIAISHPMYYSQVQFELGYSGYEEGILVAYNKDTSEYHSEVIKFNIMFFEGLRAKAESALKNEARRISNSPTSFPCRFCFKSASCWGEAKVEKECKKCAHAYAVPSGDWWCSLHKKEAVEVCESWQRYKPLDKGE